MLVQNEREPSDLLLTGNYSVSFLYLFDQRINGA